MTSPRLKDKICVVTGGAQGIGLATALRSSPSEICPTPAWMKLRGSAAKRVPRCRAGSSLRAGCERSHSRTGRGVILNASSVLGLYGNYKMRLALQLQFSLEMGFTARWA